MDESRHRSLLRKGSVGTVCVQGVGDEDLPLGQNLAVGGKDILRAGGEVPDPVIGDRDATVRSGDDPGERRRPHPLVHLHGLGPGLALVFAHRQVGVRSSEASVFASGTPFGPHGVDVARLVDVDGNERVEAVTLGRRHYEAFVLVELEVGASHDDLVVPHGIAVGVVSDVHQTVLVIDRDLARPLIVLLIARDRDRLGHDRVISGTPLDTAQDDPAIRDLSGGEEREGLVAIGLDPLAVDDRLEGADGVVLEGLALVGGDAYRGICEREARRPQNPVLIGRDVGVATTLRRVIVAEELPRLSVVFGTPDDVSTTALLFYACAA